jgi:uncharacterized damage-inducible protein DinB
MYCDITDFLEDWKKESQFTLEVFSGINDNIKTVKINDNLRSLERLAWHITQSITEMLHRAGLFDQDFLERESIPPTMEKNREIYSRYSQELATLLKEKWEKTDLSEKIEMYGENWEKRFILSVLVKHQIHHRGQMTAIMRMVGLKVPGIYGPSKEEWSKFGMAPQD